MQIPELLSVQFSLNFHPYQKGQPSIHPSIYPFCVQVKADVDKPLPQTESRVQFTLIFHFEPTLAQLTFALTQIMFDSIFKLRRNLLIISFSAKLS